eukprot:m.80544 g.80544  ORF g.80544 m.80544 type:complete len:447 (+) comp25319_c1_seq3:252-1592(+)
MGVRLTFKSLFVVCCVLLVGQCDTVRAQQEFGGIGKNTWTVNEPAVCFAWFMKYLKGAIPTFNNCPNNQCACGETGRVELLNVTGKPVVIGNTTIPDMFGIHTVNCSHHPYGTCPQYMIEEAFQTAFGDFSRYHPLMDYNLGFWTSALDVLVKRFEADGVASYPMRWSTSDGGTRFSVLVNPCGTVLLEFISDSVGTLDPAWFEEVVPRMDFDGIWNKPPPGVGGPYGLVPIKVSRATTNIAQVYIFYTGLFGTPPTVLSNVTFADGTKFLAIKLPDTSQGITSVHLQFWQSRPTPTDAVPPGGGGDDVGGGGGDPDACTSWSVASWENFIVTTNAEAIASSTCGFPKWLDFHYSYDCLDANCNLDDFVARLDRMGAKYRWVAADIKPGVLWWVLYFYDPSGYGVELHFSVTRPPSVHPNVSLIAPSCFGSFTNGTCPGSLPNQCT